VHSASEALSSSASKDHLEDAEVPLHSTEKAARWCQRLTKLNVPAPTATASKRLRIEPCTLSDLQFQPEALRVLWTEPEVLRLAIETRAAGEVLRELADNARDSGATELRIRVERSGEEARVCVEDNGSGIDPARAERIFRPLYTTRSPSRGRGVGLCIVDAHMRGCGGSVAVVVGIGRTEVQLTIPLAM
jgi:two-component system, NtrC family, sensor kinase